MRRLQRGFTLIEMMVVVAIIAIFCLVVFDLTTQTYGANPDSFSDQLASQINFARMRAVSTRHAHQVKYDPATKKVIISVGDKIGMTPPTTFAEIQETDIPNGIVIWSATAGAVVSTGLTPAQNTGLPLTIQINPDGTSTLPSPGGATIYITDPQQRRKFRVLVYQLTGSAYARPLW